MDGPQLLTFMESTPEHLPQKLVKTFLLKKKLFLQYWMLCISTSKHMIYIEKFELFREISCFAFPLPF